MGLFAGGAKVEIQEKPAAITSVEQRLDTIEAGIRGLRLEWENVYDKLMKAVSRINARHRREHAEPPPAELEEEPAPPATGMGTHAVLQQARERRARS